MTQFLYPLPPPPWAICFIPSHRLPPPHSLVSPSRSRAAAAAASDCGSLLTDAFGSVDEVSPPLSFDFVFGFCVRCSVGSSRGAYQGEGMWGSSEGLSFPLFHPLRHIQSFLGDSFVFFSPFDVSSPAGGYALSGVSGAGDDGCPPGGLAEIPGFMWLIVVRSLVIGLMEHGQENNTGIRSSVRTNGSITRFFFCRFRDFQRILGFRQEHVVRFYL